MLELVCGKYGATHPEETPCLSFWQDYLAEQVAQLIIAIKALEEIADFDNSYESNMAKEALEKIKS